MSSIRAVYGKIDQQRKDHSFEVYFFLTLNQDG